MLSETSGDNQWLSGNGVNDDLPKSSTAGVAPHMQYRLNILSNNVRAHSNIFELGNQLNDRPDMPKAATSIRTVAAMRLVLEGQKVSIDWLKDKTAGMPDADAILAWASSGQVPVVPSWISSLRASIRDNNRLLYRLVNYECSVLMMISALGVFDSRIGYDCACLMAAALVDNQSRVKQLLGSKTYTSADITMARTGHRLTLTPACDHILAEWKPTDKIVLVMFNHTPPARAVVADAVMDVVTDEFIDRLLEFEQDPPIVDMCTTDTEWIEIWCKCTQNSAADLT